MTHTDTAFSDAVRAVRDGQDVADEASRLLATLTPEERLSLLDGDQPFWDGVRSMMQHAMTMAVDGGADPVVMGAVDRLGIPGLRFTDGPRGVVAGRSTAFPVPMARGATWDVALEEKVGIAIGLEARVRGANLFGGVCVNLPRHPAWGRAQETYGEDPVLLGALGSSLTRGVQRNVMATVKHYALNSMEFARFTVDVTADEATLHEVYLPHFREVVEEGVAAVMTAYNAVNGEWAGQNEQLLQEILREEWGFRGVTVTDFIAGFRDAAASLRAGMDVEAPFAQQRHEHLRADLDEGRAGWEHVDRSALRILSTQLRHYASRAEEEPSPTVVFSDGHRALAREVAADAAVLLKNDPVGATPVLPLAAEKLTSVAVIGRLADLENTGDHGSSAVRSPDVTTALAGITAALPHARIDHVAADDPDAAAVAAAGADVAVVVAGYTFEDEGEYADTAAFTTPEMRGLFPPAPEGFPVPAVSDDTAPSGGVLPGATALAVPGGDRASLRLRPVDAEIIRATTRANPRTVVVIVTAGAVVTEEWRDEVPALLIGWYAGCEGGHALADVLFGRADPGGRLPYSIPRDESHLPFFDPHATAITYDRWHGQRLLDRDGHDAAFPLGFGLSYTAFAITGLQVEAEREDDVDTTVTVVNTGSRPGKHVVQLYGVVDAIDFPTRVLLGFAPVRIDAGTEAAVLVRGSLRPVLRRVDGRFVPAADEIVVEAASFSGDPDAVTARIRAPGPSETR
ncbi:MAG: glycoside hydrolase family 3 protein [Phycicoccus sp.]